MQNTLMLKSVKFEFFGVLMSSKKVTVELELPYETNAVLEQWARTNFRTKSEEILQRILLSLEREIEISTYQKMLHWIRKYKNDSK